MKRFARVWVVVLLGMIVAACDDTVKVKIKVAVDDASVKPVPKTKTATTTAPAQ